MTSCFSRSVTEKSVQEVKVMLYVILEAGTIKKPLSLLVEYTIIIHTTVTRAKSEVEYNDSIPDE